MTNFKSDDPIRVELDRAKRIDAESEDHPWERVMFARGVMDRCELGKKRELGQTESQWQFNYDRGYDYMNAIMGRRNADKETA